MKQHTIQTAIALALLASSAVHAQDAVQWKVANGGNGHWYRIDSIGADADYQSKVDYAHSRGAMLTSISDSNENQFVFMAAQTLGVNCRLVIGGRRSCVSCNWNWIDGSAWTYSNWGSGEPGNSGTVHVEMFVGFGQPGSWADVDDSDGSCPQMMLEWSADCNADGIVDYGQILAGQLPDANSNGVPDRCETLRVPEDFATIQAAVNAAVNGVTISVAPGSYAPFSFNGKRITVQSTSGATATTIDASGRNVSAVVFGIGASFDTTIRGFTIKTGDAGGGGGVFLNGDGTPAGNCDGTIEDCRFIRGAGNVGYGGGVYAEYGNIVVRRCMFDGLYAEHFHGAMGIAMTDYSSVPGMPGVGALIEDCEFRNCQSWNNGALGIRGIQSTKAVLRRVLFTGNVSPFSTGALLTGSPGLDGTPTPAVLQLDIDRCVFTGNSGPFSAGISEGSPYPGQFTPMSINVTGSIFADSGTSIVTQVSTQLRIQGTRFCAGAGAIGSPYTDLGGNGFSCATPTDCDSDGLPDAFAIVLGRVADVDGNGIPDICEGPTCHDIDLNLNGIVDGGDLGVLLAFWGTVSPAFPRADINRDGLVNGADLGILLAFWGPCPN
jgi:hypothetical protein